MKVQDIEIKLRPAVAEDAPLLRRWDAEPHIIAAKGTEDWEWEAGLPEASRWCEKLIAEMNGAPVGFLQIIDPALEETHYWGEIEPNLRAVDIWIGEKSLLRRGIGTRMMQLALDRCFEPPAVEAVLIDPLSSNKDAHKFYQSLGFEFQSERQFGDCLCSIYRLTRAGHDAARRGS